MGRRGDRLLRDGAGRRDPRRLTQCAPRDRPDAARSRRDLARRCRVRGAGGLPHRPRDRGRARAMGQHVRVQCGLRDLDRRRLSLPPAPLPDPVDRLHPDRRRAGAAAVRVEPALGDLAARARPPEPAAADDPRRARGDELRDLRDVVRGRGRLPPPGPGRPVRLAAEPQGSRRGRLPGGDHRLPDLRDDDHPRLVVGLDRLVPVLGLGPEGDRGSRHVALVRGLPPRAERQDLGRPNRPRCSWSWHSGW